MVLPSVGNRIAFSDLQTEFGGSHPIQLSEYYNGGLYVDAVVAGVPAIGGTITLANFNGKSKPNSGSNAVPAYYTSSSEYVMYWESFSGTSASLRTLANIATSTVIRTYTGFNSGWNLVHDKDLDSNVYYIMPEGSRVLYKQVLTKGGTSVTSSVILSYAGATTSVLGACYSPKCMGTSNGAFIIGGYSQSVLHVLEFNAAKTGISHTYTVPYTSEVYGTEVIPKDASGFTKDFGVAYTRGSRQMSSWTVNMATRTWSNRYDISYSNGVNGPSNGLGIIYYPIGKTIHSGDTQTTLNRIALNDTSTSKLYVWTITENGNQLAFTFLKTVNIATNGGYPYHLSVAAYNAIS